MSSPQNRAGGWEASWGEHALGVVIGSVSIVVAELVVGASPDLNDTAVVPFLLSIILFLSARQALAIGAAGVFGAYAIVGILPRHFAHTWSGTVCIEGLGLLAGAASFALGRVLTGAKSPSLILPNEDMAPSRLLAQELTDLESSEPSSQVGFDLEGERVPLGVIEVDQHLIVRSWAGEAESIFGVEESAALGMPLADLGICGPEAVQVGMFLVRADVGGTTDGVYTLVTSTPERPEVELRWSWSRLGTPSNNGARLLALVDRISEASDTEAIVTSNKFEVIRRLSRAAEYRDDDTGVHVQRMSRYCEALAIASGCSADEALMLKHASQMHDIGKIGIPDRILLKPGKLTAEEFEVMKKHTVIGADMLAGSDHPLLKMAETIALTHHEKWDGTGYPNGTSGEAIPLVGRICAVCDVFDALTSNRPYKSKWSIEEAAAEIARLAGNHLDPEIARTFLRILPEIEAIHAAYLAYESPNRSRYLLEPSPETANTTDVDPPTTQVSPAA